MGETPASHAVDPRLNQSIKSAFLSLPPEDRYILASHFFDQRTLADIAASTGVHESTVSRRIHRLTQSLRKRITRFLRNHGMTPEQIEECLQTDVRDLSPGLENDLRSELGTS